MSKPFMVQAARTIFNYYEITNNDSGTVELFYLVRRAGDLLVLSREASFGPAVIRNGPPVAFFGEEIQFQEGGRTTTRKLFNLNDWHFAGPDGKPAIVIEGPSVNEHRYVRVTFLDGINRICFLREGSYVDDTIGVSMTMDGQVRSLTFGEDYASVVELMHEDEFRVEIVSPDVDPVDPVDPAADITLEHMKEVNQTIFSIADLMIEVGYFVKSQIMEDCHLDRNAVQCVKRQQRFRATLTDVTDSLKGVLQNGNANNGFVSTETD